MKLYLVFYSDGGERFAYGDFWATSPAPALQQARDKAGKEPSGKPGPHRESYFTAEEV